MSDKTFDYHTHRRNSRTGMVEKIEHYVRVSKHVEGKGVVTRMERPPGSGLYYFENGDLDAELSKAGQEKARFVAAAAKEAARLAALPPVDRIKAEMAVKQRELDAAVKAAKDEA